MERIKYKIIFILKYKIKYFTKHIRLRLVLSIQTMLRKNNKITEKQGRERERWRDVGVRERERGEGERDN